MSHIGNEADPDLKAMEEGEKLSCFQRCCKCMCVAKMSQKKITDRKRSFITMGEASKKRWIGGKLDINTDEFKPPRQNIKWWGKKTVASPRSAKQRETILSTMILGHPEWGFAPPPGNLSKEARVARLTCRRFLEVIQPDEATKRKYYESDKKSSLDNVFAIHETRGLRGKYIMQTLVAINVLHGLAQLALGIYTWDDYCDYPFAELLVTCGVPNICMVVVYSLICFEQEELFPVDEDEDEEMGWPLYVAGFVIWICWILDFSAWLILCLVYKKSDNCESELENSALSTVLIRAFLIFLQLALVVLHLRAKIRDENKRNFGHNPIKSFFKRKPKYLGEDDDPEILEAISLYERTGETS